jgi:hypothetical protein
MDADAAAADPLPQAAFAGTGSAEAGAQAAVTDLYLSNALGLVRLAHIMLGSRHHRLRVQGTALTGTAAL